MTIKDLIKRYWLILAAMVMIIITVISVFSHPKPTLTEPVFKPTESPFKNSIAGTGVIEAQSENIDIGTSIPGLVTRVYVRAGDKVQINSPLFTIDDRDAKARLQAQKARLASALATLKESENQFALYQGVKDKRAISKDEMIRREDAVQINKAQVEESRANVNVTATEVDRLTVKSPINGTVLKVTINPGEYAQAGSLSEPLMVVGNIDSLNVRVEVDETDIKHINSNSKAMGFLRGYGERSVPLKFVKLEPLLIGKKTLTQEGQEHVDTKVMQILYTFDNQKLNAEVGQRMDVYIEYVPK